MQIIKSEELYVIVHHLDKFTVSEVKKLNKDHCYNKLVGFSSKKDLSEILTTLQMKDTIYGLFVIT